MVGLGINNLPGSCVTYSGLVEWLRNTTIAHNVQICERMLDFFNTGYFLSDQHIFSPINPKYDDWFCQIYKRFSQIVLKFKTYKTCVLNIRKIWQKQVVVFGWKNMLIWQRTTCSNSLFTSILLPFWGFDFLIQSFSFSVLFFFLSIPFLWHNVSFG